MIREKDIPKGATVYYLCRYASANGPCRTSAFNARCSFPRCRHSSRIEDAKERTERFFEKIGNAYYEVER